MSTEMSTERNPLTDLPDWARFPAEVVRATTETDMSTGCVYTQGALMATPFVSAGKLYLTVQALLQDTPSQRIILGENDLAELARIVERAKSAVA